MWIIENLLRVANNSQLQQPTRPGNAGEWALVHNHDCNNDLKSFPH